jgi:hypothetical protein
MDNSHCSGCRRGVVCATRWDGQAEHADNWCATASEWAVDARRERSGFALEMDVERTVVFATAAGGHRMGNCVQSCRHLLGRRSSERSEQRHVLELGVAAGAARDVATGQRVQTLGP